MLKFPNIVYSKSLTLKVIDVDGLVRVGCCICSVDICWVEKHLSSLRLITSMTVVCRRQKVAPQFTHAGLDVFGPWTVSFHWTIHVKSYQFSSLMAHSWSLGEDDRSSCHILDALLCKMETLQLSHEVLIKLIAVKVKKIKS